MRSFVISNSSDTLMGLRLAGVDGVLVRNETEALAALREAVQTEDIAVVLLTEVAAAMCADYVQQYKERAGIPVLTVIPDRHGSADMTASISRYLAETVGIHI